VDLFEYQAKELFAEYGVPVPKDKVAKHRRGGAGNYHRVRGGKASPK